MLDLYDILDDQTLDRNQDEAFNDTMQQILNNIQNVSVHIVKLSKLSLSESMFCINL